MRKNPIVFKDQPTIGEGEDATIGAWVANWATLNQWLRSSPSLENMKKAALYEAETNCRPMLLDRLLSRIFKVEKSEALQTLVTLHQ